MSPPWTLAPSWSLAYLGPQDHVEEFAHLSLTKLETILGHEKNQALSQFQKPLLTDTVFRPDSIPFRPGNMVYLPSPLVVSMPVQLGDQNPYTGSPAVLQVDVRLNAVTCKDTPDAAMVGPVPGDAGLTFSVVRDGDPDTESDAALKGWFGTRRDLKSGDKLDAGNLWIGAPKTFRVLPRITSTTYRADVEVLVEVNVRALGNFLAASVRYLPTTGALAPPAHFRAARLVELSTFRRVFEIDYYLPRVDRGLQAWISARQEIERGRQAYGKKTWFGPPYFVEKKYFTYVPGLKTTHPVTRNNVTTVERENWCGVFHGYNYKRAGFDADDKTNGWNFGGSTPASGACFESQVKFDHYTHTLGRHYLQFPRPGERLPDDDGQKKPATRALCQKWLREHLHPYGPLPGDLLPINRNGKILQHVAMVASYDPKTYELITYEGNGSADGDRGVSDRWDLADPTESGFYRLYSICRFSEKAGKDGDYHGRPADPDLLGDPSLSPDPIIE